MVAPSPERVVNTESSFSGGRAMQDFSLPSTKVGTAVTEAMADLKMASIEPGRDGVVYKIQAKTEDNRTVMVTLRPHQTQTRVSCRVGSFGDEPSSSPSGTDRRPARNTSPRRDSRARPSSPGSNPFFSRDAVPDEEMLKDAPKHRIAIASSLTASWACPPATRRTGYPPSHWQLLIADTPNHRRTSVHATTV